MATAFKLTDATFVSSRHTTHYLEAGPADGPLMMFLHGWPGIGLLWRAQIEAFASEGWRCIAPDMRGYGGSSAPTDSEAYALNEIVDDMVELHDHLGASPAIWIGHDLGCPVAGGWLRITRSGVVAWSLSQFHIHRRHSHCPTSCPLSTANSSPPTNIRMDSGITTASTWPTSIRQWPTSMQTSWRASRQYTRAATPSQ
jgi:pimeloyl-ACP methyl ester carboxylesterase